MLKPRPVPLAAFEVENAWKILSYWSAVHFSQFRTPLIRMKKAEIIKKGIELGVDYGLTHTCYDPSPAGKACGRCDSCILRRRGFEDAGVPDPTVYAAS